MSEQLCPIISQAVTIDSFGVKCVTPENASITLTPHNHLLMSLSGYQFNPMAIREAMVHDELWIHEECLVHTGHYQALEYR